MKLYVARDKNNNLYLYKELPIKNEKVGQFLLANYKGDLLKLDNNLFPDIKWENEPQEVVLLEVK